MKPFIKPGATVHVIDRVRVRSGAGPLEVVVGQLRPDANSDAFRPRGRRGLYLSKDTFETKNEAMVAWFERADAELKVETSRFNKIAAKLSSYERVTGAAARA